jgi:chemotaxis protein methyltransferase CheR
MRKSIATGTIHDHELADLRQLVERQTGVVLDCPSNVLAARAADFIRLQDLGSCAALLERLGTTEQDNPGLSSFLDGLIPTNTGFFRHPGALSTLSRQVLPQLCARKTNDGGSAIRIWSAGCSTGEEAYSIAMAVCDAVTPVNVSSAIIGGGGGNGKGSRNGGTAETTQTGAGQAKLGAGCSIHIVGSDLFPRNIEIADRGIYPLSALEGLPASSIRSYFSKVASPVAVLSNLETNGADEGLAEIQDDTRDRFQPALKGGLVAASVGVQHLLVKPRLRSLVTFNCMNLSRPGYIGRFDCIFCMDLLPHFSRAQRIALLERLHLYLEPGGYLFLSQTEKLSAPNLNFRSETFDGYTFHRKPLAASAAYGR